MIWILLACVENDLSTAEEQVPPGEPGVGVLQVEPLLIDAGDLILGQEHSEVVTVTNVGEGALFTGWDLDTQSTAWSVGGLLGMLEPGQSAELVVTFSPKTYGVIEGEILVDSEEGFETVMLTGEVLAPALAVSPAEYDFGVLTIGESASMQVLLENVGLAPLTLDTIEYTTTDSASLFASVAEPGTLEPAESVWVDVVFAPQTVGSFEGTLAVWSDDPATPIQYAAQWGVGEEEEIPIDPLDVEIQLTADDAWEAWLDGTEITTANQSGWNKTDALAYTLDPGTHVLAVHAMDKAQVIAGFIASVLEPDGTVVALSGDGSWVMTGSQPGSDWIDITYDDSAWTTPPTCADTSSWGTQPASILGTGARWIWRDSNCRSLGETWFRLVIEVDGT